MGREGVVRLLVRGMGMGGIGRQKKARDEVGKDTGRNKQGEVDGEKGMGNERGGEDKWEKI